MIVSGVVYVCGSEWCTCGIIMCEVVSGVVYVCGSEWCGVRVV